LNYDYGGITVVEIFPIVLGELLINNGSFSWKGSNYFFEEIKHIFFYWKIYTITINGIPRKKEGAIIEIGLTNGQKIQKVYGQHGVTTAWQGLVPFYNSFAKTHKNCECLSKAYQFLSSQTFKQRLDYYVKQLEKYGHFFYDNKNFFMDGRVIDSQSNVFNLRDKLCWGPFELTLSKPSEGFAQKVSSALWGKSKNDLVISTRTDKDVFQGLISYLLEQLNE
jgi:hypothetical protein